VLERGGGVEREGNLTGNRLDLARLPEYVLGITLGPAIGKGNAVGTIGLVDAVADFVTFRIVGQGGHHSPSYWRVSRRYELRIERSLEHRTIVKTTR
jgi:hypothetical protein